MTTDNNEKQPNSDSAAQRAADDRRGPSRRTASREERRNRAASRRARKRRFYMAGGLVIALALIAGLALPSFGIVNQTTDVPQAEPRAGTQLAVQDGDTLAPGETAQYDTDPPTSGPSWVEGAPWGVNAEQQPNEAVVRNLRNGAIVFNYALSDEAAVADLQSFVEGLANYPDCYVMQPHSAVPEGSVSLAAWGWTDTVAPDAAAAMQAFVNDHRANGPGSMARAANANMQYIVDHLPYGPATVGDCSTGSAP